MPPERSNTPTPLAARGAAPGPGTHNPLFEALEIRPLDAALADPTLPAILVEGAGFEPAKAEPTDLQSAPFDRFGTPPQCKQRIVLLGQGPVKLGPPSQSRATRKSRVNASSSLPGSGSKP